MFYLTRCIAAIFISLCICNYTYGQTCAGSRYISPLFDSVTVETVKFGRGPVFNGSVIDLYMDVYQPHGDTLSARPVLIFAFGGAFITGSRDDWYVIVTCTEIAKTGYVVAAIDYRINNGFVEFLNEIGQGQEQRIFFRPMQDMRAAVQYLKADFAELNNNYRIDTSKIIIGGASAGAMTSLMTAYCDKESEMAEMSGGSVTALAALGGFYSTSSEFYSDYSWKALGTFNIAGSIINAEWIEPGDIPVILGHGDADQVVPYKNGQFIPPFFDMQGSYTIDSVARAKGVCSYLYPMEGKDHPTDTMAGDRAQSIDYLKSVIYRMVLRMHAVVHNRSFCCGLNLKVNPVDTVYYEPGGDPVCLTACAVNDSGTSQIEWVGIRCLDSPASSPRLTVQPDTNLKYIVCLAYEGQCEAQSFHMVKQGTPVECDTAVECKVSSVPLWNEQEEGAQIYPHPVPGAFMLTAEFPNHPDGFVTIEIFDIAGRKVFSREFFADNRINELVDVGELSAGSYLLTVTASEIRQHHKLLIVNN